MNILMGDIEDIVKKEKHKQAGARYQGNMTLITIETM